jgi:Zn-finger nucleic acid-binding protein
MTGAPPASCPRCKVALDDQPLVRSCGRCKGSWISEAALHERVAAGQGARVRGRLTWHAEARAALNCAICAEPMETIVVRDTPVDRCPRHGIWFDANELAHVLVAVGVVAAPVIAAHQAAAAPPPESIVPDVVEGGLELAGEAAAVAAGGGEVAEAGGGVVEIVIGGVGFVADAVVEVVTGIFSIFE